MNDLEKMVWASAYVSWIKAGNSPSSAIEQASALVLGSRASIRAMRPTDVGPCTAELFQETTLPFTRVRQHALSSSPGTSSENH